MSRPNRAIHHTFLLPPMAAGFDNEILNPSTANVYAWEGTGSLPTNPFVDPPRLGIQAAENFPSYSIPSTYGNFPPTISHRVDDTAQSQEESFPGPAAQSGHTIYPQLTAPHSSVTGPPHSTTNGAGVNFRSTPYQPHSTLHAQHLYPPTHAVTNAGHSATGSYGAERPHSTNVSSDDRTSAGQRTDKPKKNVRPCGTCQSSKHRCDMEPPYSELLCRNCGEHGRTCAPHVPYSVAKDRLSRPPVESTPINGYPASSPRS